MMRLLVLLCLAGAAAAQLDQAIELERQGRFKEALIILEREIGSFRASHDDASLARALGAAGQASLSLGKYPAASAQAREALELHRKLKDTGGQARDWNTLGSSDLYSGNYPAALGEFEEALALDRSGGDAEGEITRLNNIGNVYYFQGGYLDALRRYEAALTSVNAASNQTWSARRRQITIANLATLYQRLGREERALELYSQFRAAPNALPPSEQAQLLLNEGVLFRRLGDPVKALELYQSAESLFATEQNRDAEIRALQSIGIVRGLDLQDLHGALQAFTAAFRLAQESGNSVGEVQVRVYRGEVLRRLNRFPEASAELRDALAGAEHAGLIEEQWKALYAMARIAEAGGDTERAREYFEGAIRRIESVRAGLQLTALKTDFLADKRDVYDGLIALNLTAPQPSPAELYRLVEQSRARTLQDQIKPPKRSQSALPDVQARLEAGSLIVEYWMAGNSIAALWIASSGVGIVKKAFTTEDTAMVHEFTEALAQGSPGWKRISSALGKQLLEGLPLDKSVRRLVFIPDGVLQTLPFEALELPNDGSLVIEKFVVSYLPAAALIANSATHRTGWRFPWQLQLVAIGDPIGSGSAEPAGLQATEEWQRLPHSAEEVREIARILPGRAEQHLGTNARKSYLGSHALESVPILHLSTHASADMQDPERSRIVFAPATSGAPFDYLFLREIYGLDLKGVDLVTISACETERGRQVRGEGAQGFSRAFLAAGAGASVTSLWRVVDQPTAEFMKQFYHGLARRQTKAEALRTAKLAFLNSGSRLAHPRYWAAFVLSGDGGSPLESVVPWSALLGSVALAILILAMLLRRQGVAAKGRKGSTVEEAVSPNSPKT